MKLNPVFAAAVAVVAVSSISAAPVALDPDASALKPDDGKVRLTDATSPLQQDQQLAKAGPVKQFVRQSSALTRLLSLVRKKTPEDIEAIIQDLSPELRADFKRMLGERKHTIHVPHAEIGKADTVSNRLIESMRGQLQFERESLRPKRVAQLEQRIKLLEDGLQSVQVYDSLKNFHELGETPEVLKKLGRLL